MLVSVAGPNLRDQSRGSFHVHAAGCADLVKGARREPEYGRPWTFEASSVSDVVLTIYGDMIEDESDASEVASYRSDVHVFPCCAGLEGAS